MRQDLSAGRLDTSTYYEMNMAETPTTSMDSRTECSTPADEQALHEKALRSLIEHQRSRGVPELAIVRAVGLALGFGRLMQFAEQAWRGLAIQRGHPGTEFTVGPCASALVPCPHPAGGLDANGHCDWCCGDGRVTARVRRAIEEVASSEPSATVVSAGSYWRNVGAEPAAHTPRTIRLVWYQRPDGRWNADCACEATVCGILEEERWMYENWHLAHARKEREQGHKHLPCGPKLPDPNPNLPGPPVFR